MYKFIITFSILIFSLTAFASSSNIESPLLITGAEYQYESKRICKNDYQAKNPPINPADCHIANVSVKYLINSHKTVLASLACTNTNWSWFSFKVARLEIRKDLVGYSTQRPDVFLHVFENEKECKYFISKVWNIKALSEYSIVKLELDEERELFEYEFIK